MRYLILLTIIFFSLSIQAALTVTMNGTTICQGTTITLSPTITGGVGPYSYEWTGGNITGNTGATEQDNPTGTTSYKVVVTDGSNGDKDSATVIITVNSLPVINAGNDDAICPGENTMISSTGGTSYQWSPSAGLSNTNIANPVASPTITTIYTVTGTDANGCVSTDDVTITVNTLPIANDQTPPVICEGAFVDLTVHESAINGGGVTYAWFSDAGLTTPIATPTSVIVNNGKVFYVNVTDAVTGCAEIAMVTYTTNPLPNITATDVAVCKDNPVTISANSSGATGYVWSSLDGGLINSGGATATPEVQTDQPGATSNIVRRYEVTVTDANGCTNKDTVHVTFDADCINVGIKDQEKSNSIKIVPNPSNGNFILEIESSKIETMQFSIYDVTGKVVLKKEMTTVVGKQEHKIDLTSFSAKGLYFLNIKATEGNYTKKIIVN